MKNIIKLGYMKLISTMKSCEGLSVDNIDEIEGLFKDLEEDLVDYSSLISEASKIGRKTELLERIIQLRINAMALEDQVSDLVEAFDEVIKNNEL